jgi:hypothetical protein
MSMSHHHRHKWSLRIIAAMLSCVAVTSVAQPAQAAEGLDPHVYGCDSNAVNLRTAQMPNYSLRMVDPTNGNEIGYAYLRYGNYCAAVGQNWGAQWVKVNYNSGYSPDPHVWVQNQTGTDQGISSYSPWQGTVWTYVLTDMQNRAGCGGVHIYRTSGAYVKWFYLGCA